ncbi:MAG: FkbM family methyltransferase [Actinobacteria bacterium]|nr:FkbM family methyltransferase [Actinomycetota bacterium]
MKLKINLRLLIQALIGAFTRKILGTHVYALIAKSDSGLFAVDPEDCGVGRELRMTGKYGLDEIERLKPHITLDSRVLIVGAHVGTLAIPISKLCKDVVAIEANPATYDLLTINIALNSSSNCQAINIAASDKDENIEFLLSRANSGGSKRVPIIKEFMYYYDNPKIISVKAVSLDNYLKEKDFDIVVMDIEGSEYFALQGMQEIIAKCKLLAVEFLPHHLKNVSGVTVAQFLSVIAPHFSKLTIPSKQLSLNAPDFISHLTNMYNLEQGDEGIIFQKV